MKKLLLWDIDGTILMAKGAGKRAMDRAFLQLYGIEGAFDGIGMAGGLDLHFIDLAYRKHGIEAPEKLDAFFEVYAEALRDEMVIDAPILAPGVLEALEWAEQEPHLYNALGTGNVEIGARIKLEVFDLNRFFPVGGFCEGRVERYEVLQQGVENARAYYGVPFAPEQVVVIGDTVKDIDAARKIGAQVIAVATGGHSFEALEAAKPDLLVQTLAESDFWERVFGK